MIYIIMLFILTSCSSQIEVIESDYCKDIRVFVSGEVIKEKELILPCESTIKDVLERIELNENADISMLNLKMPVYNNDQIIIPKYVDKRISINYGTKEELMSVKGIGEKTAEAIIEYREMNGLFIELEQIMEVKGIGEKKFASMLEYISL